MFSRAKLRPARCRASIVGQRIREMTSEDGEESDRERMITNVVVALFLVVLVGAGLWLANAMVGLRKTQDCVFSGRKNCAPISVPGRGETW
jgi:hypothetical protein